MVWRNSCWTWPEKESSEWIFSSTKCLGDCVNRSWPKGNSGMNLLARENWGKLLKDNALPFLLLLMFAFVLVGSLGQSSEVLGSVRVTKKNLD
jgi:hypothetical protein